MADTNSLKSNGKETSSEDKFRLSAPQISLPKGGGAIRGIGEKFAANPVTGTGSMTVPIATSPGRSGFGPQLSLSYDSGAGNGSFGFGWSLSLPAITRKTDKGLPLYQDAEESDVFILSGAEDLVPVLIDKGAGKWEQEQLSPRTVDGKSYRIQRYRPRIEGLFARIERWTNQSDATDTFWRSISKDNITTWYGRTENSRIASADMTCIFSWLICESYDDKGNVIAYEYNKENSDKIDRSQAHERNRTGDTRKVNRYLQHIRYGNHKPYFPKLLADQPWPTLPGDNQWFFEVVFDYDEGRFKEQLPDPDGRIFAHVQIDPPAGSQWPVRQDPFSSYRAGFEIRTYRLCRRVLMFHHFPGEAEVGADCLVRSTDFTYSDEVNPTEARNPIYSFLLSVTQSGYKRQGGGYLKKSLPPVEFEYTEPIVQEEIHEVDSESLENLPVGLDGSSYQWTDLHGEGIPGILTEQGSGWFYKRNLSPINEKGDNGTAQVAAKFAPIEQVAVRPNLALAGGAQFMDLAGDGQPDLVALNGPMPGLYEHDDEEGWQPFRPFTSRLNRDMRDPNLKFIDLDGNGHADVLITEDDTFVWHSSLAEEGFSPARRVTQALDEEKGPRIVFADGTQSIYLADLSGDGLTDIVRIRNGEVCYWPNLGYGRFGAKVTMDNSPLFDYPDQFDQKRIRLADIDGSGTVDLLYFGSDRIDLYFNQSGNRWSPARTLRHFPKIDNLSSVTTVDLLGNGTACLVWSSPLPGDARRPMRYIDLMGGQKPHLLVKTRNNLGGETEIQYAPSTQFYLADKQAGRPWITKLPFPVHCVEKVTVKDKWRDTEFSTTYSYHHGYFDGIEREFRGFGRVEQVDVESYGEFTQGNVASPYITDNHELYQPPIKTITWYHTGFALDRDRILSAFEQEYFSVPGFAEHKLPQPTLTADLTAEEWREAARACKGMVLRQEVFELDVDAIAQGQHTPVRLYTTAYHNSDIKRLQPQGDNRHAVFLVTESEAITYHYELDLRPPAASADPRIAHTLNLKIDRYGNILESAAAVYPRIGINTDTSLTNEQRALINQVQKNESHLALNCTRFTDDIDDPNTYRLRMPCQTQAWEVTGIQPAGRYFTLAELKNKDLTSSSVAEISYHQQPNGTPQKRLVECARTLYFADNLIDHRPFGQHGPLGLPFESYKLALTRNLINRVYVDAERINTALSALENQVNNYPVSGYYKGNALFAGHPITPEPLENQYWIASGRAGFESDAAQHFYLPERYTDPFGNLTRLNYDGKYDLFIQTSTDALGNTTGIATERTDPADPLTERPRFDYRVLAPLEMVDANGNYSELVFDVLGLPVAMAIKGKPQNPARTLWEADNLQEFKAGTTGFELCNPTTEAIQDFCLAPVMNEDTARVWLGNATTRFVYHFGNKAGQWNQRMAGACSITREKHGDNTSDLQVSLECSDGGGNVLMKKVQAEPDPLTGQERWIVNGLTVLNNKGKAVKQYEPAFSDRFGCELPQANGVTPIMYYDAAGRVARTEMPDGTLSKVEFSPWHVKALDANDTVKDSRWYFERLTATERGVPLHGLNDSPQQKAEASAAEALAQISSAEDKRAAQLAAVHAATPALTILDSLGREVIAIAHNRVEDSNGPITINGIRYRDENYLTFTKLDAEGKPLWIRDARGNLVMQYITPHKANDDPSNLMPASAAPCYDIAGNLLYQHSMDAGDRWMLMDAAGKPMLAWDFNQRQLPDNSFVDEQRLYFTDYDALHRPTALWLVVNGNPRVQTERYEYRDTRNPDGGANTNLANDKAANLIGQLVRHYDPGGRLETVRRDFKGNVREIRRRLNNVPTESVIDWQNAPENRLEGEVFSQITEYDALNRMTRLFNWHRGEGSRVAVYVPVYSERGLLKSEQLITRARKVTRLDGKDDYDSVDDVTSPRVFQGTRDHDAIKEIRYNAKGQKEYLKLGNNTVTCYDYDAKTFRLRQLRTTRLASGQTEPPFPGFHSNLSDGRVLQQLHYTYDPVGNISEIYDEAYEPVFFMNQQVEPRGRYTYDALYRLIEAEGREGFNPPNAPTQREGAPRKVNLFPLTDQTLRNYTQLFTYDAVGNILRMRHIAAQGNWHRRYAYATDSNRLLRTWEGHDDWNSSKATRKTEYRYDSHGSMRNTANVAPGQYLRWDHRDMIASLDLQGGGWAYYQYDAAKQRTRKRLVRNGGSVEERIYLGGFELYRRYTASSNGPVEEIESHHLFEGEQRVLLVDDVIKTNRRHADHTLFKTEPILRYQYSNHLGSACIELDHLAGIISYEEYHPYGTSAYRAMKSGIEAPPKRYRYTGMERDEESGLSYHSARYYVPLVGRWTSCDPIELGDGINVYAFVNGNPLRMNDRSGTKGVHDYQLMMSYEEGAQSTNRHRDTDIRTVDRLPRPGEMKPSDVIPDDVGVIDNYAYYKSYECFSNQGPGYCEEHAKMAESRLLLFKVGVHGGGGPPWPIPAKYMKFRGLPAPAPGEELPPLRINAPVPPADEPVVVPKSNASQKNVLASPVAEPLPAAVPSGTQASTPVSSQPKQLPPGKQQLLLEAGNPTSKTIDQVAKTKGTGNERGQAHNQHMEEAYGAGGKAEKTQSGVRIHDATSTKPSLTDLRFEGKNWLRYIGVKGKKGGTPREVPLNPEIRAQAIKDFQWKRAGKRAGIDRHVQWDFASAPPSPQLEKFLTRLGLSWVVHSP